MFLSTSLLSACALLVFGTAALLLRKRKGMTQAPSRSRPGLPPLDPEQSLAVIREAEQSAIRTALGTRSVETNPYPSGTRAHILWETQYHSVLMDWNEDH